MFAHAGIGMNRLHCFIHSAVFNLCNFFSLLTTMSFYVVKTRNINGSLIILDMTKPKKAFAPREDAQSAQSEQSFRCFEQPGPGRREGFNKSLCAKKLTGVQLKIISLPALIELRTSRQVLPKILWSRHTQYPPVPSARFSYNVVHIVLTKNKAGNCTLYLHMCVPTP